MTRARRRIAVGVSRPEAKTVDSGSAPLEPVAMGHVLFDAAERLGCSDPTEIARFARRLARGLPAEDELCVVFRWLGRCKLVHKLDQLPYPPDARKVYRVPDLLAVFDVDGTAVPVLIEVKVSTDNVLSWKPEYLETLQRYAALLRLPLLVAWKHQTIWTLFETRHLQKATKNLNISFAHAITENLLGILAGDFSFNFRTGVGVHMKMRKINRTDSGFRAQVEEIYFLNAAGEKHKGVGGILELFCCIDQEVHIQEDDTRVVQSLVIETDESQFAHRALVQLLDVFGERGNRTWRQVLLDETLPLLSTSPQQAALNGLDAGFIQHCFTLAPKSLPAFLPAQP